MEEPDNQMLNARKRKRDEGQELENPNENQADGKGTNKNGSTTAVEGKQKTVAKQRYLKRKKDRAKNKKRAEVASRPKGEKSRRSEYGGEIGDVNAQGATESVELPRQFTSENQPLGNTDDKDPKSVLKVSTKDRTSKRPKDKVIDDQEGPLDEKEWERRQEEAKARRKEEKRRKREKKKEKREAGEDFVEKSRSESDGEVIDPLAPPPDIEGENENNQLESEKEAVEPGPLYRLPAPTHPLPPDTALLARLAIAPDLADDKAIILDAASRDTPVDAFVEAGLLNQGLALKLKKMEIEGFFTVQAAVLPLLLSHAGTLSTTRLYPNIQPRDVLVSAPTGSGKTLSYVLPVIQILASRIVARLRALVILPTKDLVTQVHETFCAFTKGTGLKVGIATGQHSFVHEQRVLVGDTREGLAGGSSKVDILIATPGRLMDHIRGTQNFSLQHLRFLVVDEADRLLNQSFHEWLSTVLSQIRPPTSRTDTHDGAQAPSWQSVAEGLAKTDIRESTNITTQKLLFSATLTRDPAKVAALGLSSPIFVSVQNKAKEGDSDAQLFTLPSKLKESMIVTVSTSKPLMLFHLLHGVCSSSILCFTKSVESASRLVQLVEFFEEEWASRNGKQYEPGTTAKCYSSELSSGERARALTGFKEGKFKMIVCSDLIARGMDLPHVAHVISYDVPVDMQKYVHRVGRTARAGREGHSWSLVESQEAAFFKQMMTQARRTEKVERIRLRQGDIKEYVEPYEAALSRLKTQLTS